MSLSLGLRGDFFFFLSSLPGAFSKMQTGLLPAGPSLPPSVRPSLLLSIRPSLPPSVGPSGPLGASWAGFARRRFWRCRRLLSQVSRSLWSVGSRTIICAHSFPVLVPFNWPVSFQTVAQWHAFFWAFLTASPWFDTSLVMQIGYWAGSGRLWEQNVPPCFSQSDPRWLSPVDYAVMCSRALLGKPRTRGSHCFRKCAAGV